MWSTVAMSSAMWMGWARGKSTTARPMRMRWVRAAMALAIVMGEDKTVIGKNWSSASHTELTPRASAASTNAKHSAKASRSVIPSRYGNSMKSPKSMGVSLLADEARRGGPLADPGKVSLGDLRAWRLRGGDVHRDRPSSGGCHVGPSHLIPVEPGGPFHVGDVEDDMPDLFGCAHSDSLLFQPRAGPRFTVASPLCREGAVPRNLAQSSGAMPHPGP